MSPGSTRPSSTSVEAEPSAPAPRRRNGPRATPRAVLIAVEVGATALILAGVWAYTASAHSFYITPLPKIVSTFRSVWLFAHFTSDFLPSLARLLAGFAIAVLVGLALGIALAHSLTLRLLSQPIVSFLRSMPAAALLPGAIVLFGIGSTMKVIIIAFVCIWPVLLNALDGMLELDITLLDTASSYHVAGLDRLRFITLPAIGPRVFAGMRTSLSLAVLMMVISEMVAATNGIGFFVVQQQRAFAIPEMWSGVLLLGLVGYGLNLLFTVGEHRALHWHLRMQAAGAEQ